MDEIKIQNARVKSDTQCHAEPVEASPRGQHTIDGIPRLRLSDDSVAVSFDF